MSYALPLPARPNIEHYKTLAKDLVKASRSHALHSWFLQWLRHRSEALDQSPPDGQLEEEAWWLEDQWRERFPSCKLADAQFFLAREHGFASWPKFKHHIEAINRSESAERVFEQAADAIVGGDIDKLRKLLREHPKLIHARSTREHRSTLLHYVSANGVEDFRQKTPQNIVEIATLLLDAGADVNAESDAYGGHSTTLGLAATSWHPEHAGVQIPLLQLLIDHGANIDGPDSGSGVTACLHNGRKEAAEFLAERGARLDLEGAAGVGRLDIVQTFFAVGRLTNGASEQQFKSAFAWACEFGRTEVVEFLLDHGMTVGEGLPHDGQIGLHWAAMGGHADTVKLLLDRNSDPNATDKTYKGTPLDWALYGWSGQENQGTGDFYSTIGLLIRAGAKIDGAWMEQPGREQIRKRLAGDEKMRLALNGESPV